MLLAPLALGVGLAFNSIMNRARSRSATHTSWLLMPGIAMAGLLVGICSHWWPELPGNGSSILEISLNSSLTLVPAAALLALKPLLTAIYLRAGAIGGLLTPALATGAATATATLEVINAVPAARKFQVRKTMRNANSAPPIGTL